MYLLNPYNLADQEQILLCIFIPYKDAWGSHTCNLLFLFRSPAGVREAGAGMALSCVWWCRPRRGLGAGSRAEGRKQLERKRQFLKPPLAVVPPTQWVMRDAEQGRHAFPSFCHSVSGGGGKKRLLQPFSQEARLCIVCPAAVYTSTLKPCRQAWPHRCCGKFGNCRETVCSHCPGKRSP